jgi:hypothetical protein
MNLDIKKQVQWLVTVLSALPLAHAENLKFYQVKTGETLSHILDTFNFKPIYGSAGALRETLKHNPELKKSKGNLIFPGQTIMIPYTAEDVVMAPAVEPTAATAASEPEVPVQQKQRAQLTAWGGVDFFSLKGTDKATNDSSHILSDPSLSVGMGVSYFMNDKMALSLATQVQRFKLQPLNDRQSFQSDQGLRGDLSLFSLYQFNEDLTLGTGVAFEQDLFVRATSSDELKLDKVFITKPQLSAHYNVLKGARYLTGVEGKLGLNLGKKTDDYTIKSGTHISGGVFFNYFTHSPGDLYRALGAKISYRSDKQDTSLTTREFKNLSFMLNYSWEVNW